MPLSRIRRTKSFLLLLALATFACGDGENLVEPGTGGLEVTTTTTGAEPDADGYTITLDGADRGAVAANGQVALDGLSVGEHLVGLTGVAGNCAVQGDNPVTVRVIARATATAAFAVTCSAAPPSSGTIRVVTATNGPTPDPNGYSFSLDAGTAQPIGVNATATVSNIAAGDHSVQLSDLAANCTVQGANPQVVTLASGGTADVSFTITCAGPAGALRWTVMETNTTQRLFDVSGTGPNNVFAIGEDVTGSQATIHHYDGTAWSTQLTMPGSLRAVWANSASSAFAAGSGRLGIFLRYDGQRWAEMTPATVDPAPLELDIAPHALWGSSANDVFAVGVMVPENTLHNAYIAHYDGTAWSRMTYPGSDWLELLDVWGSSGSNVYAVGIFHVYDSEPSDDRAIILRYDGTGWSEVLREPNLLLRKIWVSPTGEAFATGYTLVPNASGALEVGVGAIRHFNGSGWLAMASPTNAQLGAIWGTSSSDFFVLAGGNGPFGSSGTVWHFNGADWTEMNTGVNSLYAIWGSSATDVFAVGENGNAVHGTP
jgi:hypothetical protein